MNVSLKLAGALTLGALIVGLAAGRFSLPSSSVTETKGSLNVEDHSHITRTRKTQPDGTQIVVTEIRKDVQSETLQNSRTEVTRDAPRWKVDGLAGLNIGSSPGAAYGVAVSRQFIGPLWLGAVGIKTGEGILGMASVGIQF